MQNCSTWNSLRLQPKKYDRKCFSNYIQLSSKIYLGDHWIRKIIITKWVNDNLWHLNFEWISETNLGIACKTRGIESYLTISPLLFSTLRGFSSLSTRCRHNCAQLLLLKLSKAKCNWRQFWATRHGPSKPICLNFPSIQIKTEIYHATWKTMVFMLCQT